MAWHSVLGHESVLEQFRSLIQQKRLAHAYLFVGPEGIGKRLFAVTLSQALLCENRQDDSFTLAGAVHQYRCHQGRGLRRPRPPDPLCRATDTALIPGQNGHQSITHKPGEVPFSPGLCLMGLPRGGYHIGGDRLRGKTG